MIAAALRAEADEYVAQSSPRKPLTAFYDFPAEHWRHLRTTNPIESSFATVKLRTKGDQGRWVEDRSAGDGLPAADRGRSRRSRGLSVLRIHRRA
jgi:Transposase, Mutator family